MKALIDEIDNYFGVLYGITHAAALFAAAWLMLLVATFLIGRASARRRR